MLSIVMDEFRPSEIMEIINYMDIHFEKSGIQNLFSINIPSDLLSEEQKKFEFEEGPYKIYIDVRKQTVVAELLVRGELITNKGSCIATDKQISYIIQILKNMAQKLNLITCM
jgi:hypothetical protein